MFINTVFADIQFATNMATKMVKEWGMSDVMGPLQYGDYHENYLGQGGQATAISDQTADKIDSEIRRIVEESYDRAKNILMEKLDDLHTLAKALLEYETLTGDEIKQIIKDGVLKRDEPKKDDDTKNRPAGSVPTGGVTFGNAWLNW